MPNFRIRSLSFADLPAWKNLRRALWPFLTETENERECQDMLDRPDRFAVFLSESAAGIDGFVEANLREYAEGCDSHPVGFIEGWYVTPESRRGGVGRALVAAAENWARSKGCTEMGSDTPIDNVDSQRAHERLGYSEAERLVCFRKEL